MKVLNVLLSPFALLFRLATGVRNYLYTIGHKRSFTFEVPVICVGNLNIGGSGKTPAIEYLVRLLRGKYEVATLSRGYGRRTRGLRFARDTDSATTVGDEPFQFYRNFGEEIKVVVGEDRAFAIPHILHEFQSTNVILLDDAFQHRSVTPQLAILLTSFDKPFYKDYLLPMGRLRESRSEARRADIIIVTKCPSQLADEEEDNIKKEIARYAPDKPVFFSEIKYGTVLPFWETSNSIGKKIILVTGIAKTEPLDVYIGENFELLKHFRFKDHHNYTLKDIQSIVTCLEQHPGSSLLTTEKDMVRLLDPAFAVLRQWPCFYLPIEMIFRKNGADFDMQVLNVIEKVHATAQSLHE